MDLRLAYACFLFYGLAWLTMGVGVVLVTVLRPFDEGWAALLGIGIAVPLLLASFVTLLVGIVESVILCKRSLTVLSVLSLVTPVVDFGEYGGEGVSTALAVSGGLAITLISGRGLWRNI